MVNPTGTYFTRLCPTDPKNPLRSMVFRVKGNDLTIYVSGDATGKHEFSKGTTPYPDHHQALAAYERLIRAFDDGMRVVTNIYRD